MTAADLGIRFSLFEPSRPNEWPLIIETVAPVCSPAFADQHGLAGDIDTTALTHIPLLHMDERDPRWLDWTRWCAWARPSIDQNKATSCRQSTPTAP